MTILKLMGCSGAGKTTAARTLLSHATSVIPILGLKKEEGYETVQPGINSSVFLLGNYRGANCGGMDTVSSAAEAIAMVAEFAPQGHVVHEGLLQSTYYGKMGTDSQRYGADYIYVLLDTPIEVCLDRVVARREANGSTNKFNPQLTRDKHAQVRRAWETAAGHGHRTAVLYWDEPIYPQLLELLK